MSRKPSWRRRRGDESPTPGGTKDLPEGLGAQWKASIADVAAQRVERYRTMLRIRRFEEMAIYQSSLGKVYGSLHAYIGQEAVAVGVIAALRPDDYVTSTHRGHGHAIAKGVAIESMMAELFGRTTGVCHGKGGSMHIADFSKGMLGANGVVAGGVPIAAGAAWAAQRLGMGRVVACFFGESATNRGQFHEGLNLAASWLLPVLYVCENNLYGQYTHISKVMPLEHVAHRATAYAMPSKMVDGNNVEAVYGAASEMVDKIRAGAGPMLLECKTYRYLGHALGDTGYYRTKEEVAMWRARDPILLARKRLQQEGLLNDGAAERIATEVEVELEAAVAFAEKGPYPDPKEDLLTDVYASSMAANANGGP